LSAHDERTVRVRLDAYTMVLTCAARPKGGAGSARRKELRPQDELSVARDLDANKPTIRVEVENQPRQSLGSVAPHSFQRTLVSANAEQGSA
jgi:hypothetical protein